MVGIEKILLTFRGTFVLDTDGRAQLTSIYPAKEGIEKLPKIKDIAAPLGQDTYLMLSERGEIFGFGGNEESLLGDPPPWLKTSGIVQPMARIHPELPSNLVAIAAADTVAMALDSDHFLWAWGDDRWGQFSSVYSSRNGEAASRLDISDVWQMQLGTGHLWILHLDGTVAYTGLDGHLSTIEGLPPIKEIALGGDCTIGLSTDGDVFSWGPGHSVLGKGREQNARIRKIEGLSGVISIASGYDYALAVLADGAVIGWGNLEDRDTRVTALTDRTVVKVGLEPSAFPRLWKGFDNTGQQTLVGMLPQFWAIQDVFRKTNSKGLQL